jgi:phosphatidylglycerol:prolipoprotein diacylglycerol transferase
LPLLINIVQTFPLTFPWQITLAGAAIPLHPVIETAAIFVGFRFFLTLRKKDADAISTPSRIYIIIGAIFGAVLGSRLIGGLEDIEALSASNNFLLHFYQNKTIVGGLLGGLAGVELIKKLIGEKQSSGDLFVFPLILAMIIGRAGCFGMGVYEQTYGIETTAAAGMDLGDGLRRHPLMLYEILFLILMWWRLRALAKSRELAPGGLFKVFMVAYLLFRFGIEFLKPRYTWSVGLSTIQLTCLIGLAYYFNFIANPRKLLASYA